MKSFILLLRKPRMILVGMLLGILLGAFSPMVGSKLGIIGDFYLSLIKMCVFPIIVLTMITSFARLFRVDGAVEYIPKMIFVFGVGMFAVSFYSWIAASTCIQWLSGSENLLDTLSSLMEKREAKALTTPNVTTLELLESFIPPNIFRALSDGQVTGCFVFMMTLGLAIGVNKKETSTSALHLFEGLKEALMQMMDWFLTILPIGLLAIFARTASQMNAKVLMVMFNLILMFLFCTAGLICLQLTVFFAVLKRGSIPALRSLKEAFLVAFGTSSSMTALSPALQSLQSVFKTDKWAPGLILPLGVTFNSQASVMGTVIISVFTAQIYHIHFGFKEIGILLIGSIAQSIIGAGIPAAAAFMSLAIVFRPLGLPVEAAFVLLAIVIPLIDPILTVANVLGNCTSAFVIQKLKKEA